MRHVGVSKSYIGVLNSYVAISNICIRDDNPYVGVN